MISNTDSIIFDVDGTLWDSTEIVAIGYNRALEAYTDLPIRVDGARLMTLFGKPMDQIFAELLPELSGEQQHFISEKCVILEEEELEKADPASLLYPGIEEMFQKLSKKLPLFIVSNCQCGYIEQFLRKNHFESYITDHLCFGQTGTSKGQTILRLMKENHLKNPVYVGDTQGDANACREAGIPFILAEYGFGDVPDPDARIQKPLDLISMF
ncbi:HAD family hydrolase [Jingyaoa shaoxingensis]|uniref:HAD family hydrolase n=1 Tax=Jingyaoa shaoxingensis TaxID=2763671 RepID=A0ABR7N807_9FIRM|nr:HAD family hydrolase [Jingyaoa shaoxingensis]MBC8572540.1 HAD family hydrolase [Jingyaoa shaoxingensis]